ncbi:MAG: hypothetical protein AVDCRST_MAG73-2430 [uncultured Thermomicrobiales bacterium]|uniref:Uncharacterized protein n=1 Tax=uncultured Thermomicrobiales bacterium TaxID=1645740 RepID=A0A6J4UEF9_9BACT|nr:MAG: hypothetical protein AVDCRST_MAG73-2430 [uncultured Thermomicrobiales bacterium]
MSSPPTFSGLPFGTMVRIPASTTSSGSSCLPTGSEQNPSADATLRASLPNALSIAAHFDPDGTCREQSSRLLRRRGAHCSRSIPGCWPDSIICDRTAKPTGRGIVAEVYSSPATGGPANQRRRHPRVRRWTARRLGHRRHRRTCDDESPLPALDPAS